MSTFQLSLVIMGIVIVVAVIAYNMWHVQRHQPRKPQQTHETSSTRAQTQRLDPSLDVANSVTSDAYQPAITPSFKNSSEQSAHSSLESSDLNTNSKGSASNDSHLVEKKSYPQELNDIVYSIANIVLDSPISGDLIHSKLPTTRRIGSKQFIIVALNISHQNWELITLGERYTQVQTGVQLANRQGPLTEIEFSEFIGKTQTLADELGGDVQFSDMLHETARAREIDSFAENNDALLQFKLIAKRSVWSPGYIALCADEFGFKPSNTPGQLILPAVQRSAPAVLTLNYDPQAALADNLDHAPIDEILLSLDVPNVDRSENAFGRLQHILESLAQTMDGSIVDQNRNPLPSMVMDTIIKDLERLYEVLEARGIPAGSIAAQKLFS